MNGSRFDRMATRPSFKDAMLLKTPEKQVNNSISPFGRCGNSTFDRKLDRAIIAPIPDTPLSMANKSLITEPISFVFPEIVSLDTNKRPVIECPTCNQDVGICQVVIVNGNVLELDVIQCKMFNHLEEKCLQRDDDGYICPWKCTSVRRWKLKSLKNHISRTHHADFRCVVDFRRKDGHHCIKCN